MRYLAVEDILYIHDQQIRFAGGDPAVLDLAKIESAVAQPQMTFVGEDLYPTLHQKAAAIGFSLIKNHPFLDGNKRTGQAALELFLWLNGFEIEAATDEQEAIILGVASGSLGRDGFSDWLREHIVSR